MHILAYFRSSWIRMVPCLNRLQPFWAHLNPFEHVPFVTELCSQSVCPMAVPFTPHSVDVQGTWFNWRQSDAWHSEWTGQWPKPTTIVCLNMFDTQTIRARRSEHWTHSASKKTMPGQKQLCKLHCLLSLSHPGICHLAVTCSTHGGACVSRSVSPVGPWVKTRQWIWGKQGSIRKPGLWWNARCLYMVVLIYLDLFCKSWHINTLKTCKMRIPRRPAALPSVKWKT